jgi:hypothetical protein
MACGFIFVVIFMGNRMTVNNSCLWSHLGWIGVVESHMCVSSRAYETIVNIIWGLERFDAQRPQTFVGLESNWHWKGNVNQGYVRWESKERPKEVFFFPEALQLEDLDNWHNHTIWAQIGLLEVQVHASSIKNKRSELLTLVMSQQDFNNSQSIFLFIK